MEGQKKYPETLEAAITEIDSLQTQLTEEKTAHLATTATATKEKGEMTQLITELTNKLASSEKNSTTSQKIELAIEVESEDETGKKVKVNKNFQFPKSFKANHNGSIVTAEDVLASKELASELAECNVFEEVKA